MAQLTKLSQLNVWGNALEGPLPALAWANLTTCDVLDRENRFSCPLPAALLANAKCVTELHLGGAPRRAASTDCFAMPPVPTNCSGWSGQLGAEQCGAWIDLYTAAAGVGWTGLTCPLMSTAINPRTNPCLCQGTDKQPICNGTDIVNIALANSRLVGTLPKSLAALTKLQRLMVPQNQLRGELDPALLAAWAGSLVALDVSYNALGGVLPRTLANLTELRLLNVWVNRFDGPLPQGVPWAQLTEGCSLLADTQYALRNRFNCPLPNDAVRVCKRLGRDGKTPTALTVLDCTNDDPTPRPTPAPTPLVQKYDCVDGQCIVSSGGAEGVPQKDCLEVCAADAAPSSNVGATVGGTIAATVVLGAGFALLRRRKAHLGGGIASAKAPLLSSALWGAGAGGDPSDLESVSVVAGGSGVALEDL